MEMEEDEAPDAVTAPVETPSQPTEAEAAPQQAPVEAEQQEAEAPEQPSTTAPPSEPAQPDVEPEAATPVSITLPSPALPMSANVWPAYNSLMMCACTCDPKILTAEHRAL